MSALTVQLEGVRTVARVVSFTSIAMERALREPVDFDALENASRVLEGQADVFRQLMKGLKSEAGAKT